MVNPVKFQNSNYKFQIIFKFQTPKFRFENWNFFDDCVLRFAVLLRITSPQLLLTLFFVAFLHHVSFAQDVRATARVDSNNILIGDWLRLHIEVEHAENITVQFPSIPDSLQGFEIIRRDSLLKTTSNNKTLESMTYVLTSYDSGMYIIPPLVFQYAFANDTTLHTTETAPIPIVVHSVGVDTTKDIKDIKPPVTLPISFAEVLPYIIGVIGAGGFVWLIYYIMKKRKKGEPIIPEAPPRPAHEVALEALHSLEAEKLWQRGLVKEYHSQVTDIIRTYIERRYNVIAMEMVTEEILSSPSITALDKQNKEQLRDMLVLADLVKFAKFHPVQEEHERSLRFAFSFVETTWQTIQEIVKHETAQEVIQQ